MTYLSQGVVDAAKKEDIVINPLITQFGWQFEKKFLSTESGPEGISAIIPFVGGLEQNLVIPSVSWLIGLRLQNGFEFAMGPILSVGGSGMVMGIGHSSKFGELYIPKNLSLTFSKTGMKFSLTFGFNSQFQEKE